MCFINRHQQQTLSGLGPFKGLFQFQNLTLELLNSNPFFQSFAWASLVSSASGCVLWESFGKSTRSIISRFCDNFIWSPLILEYVSTICSSSLISSMYICYTRKSVGILTQLSEKAFLQLPMYLSIVLLIIYEYLCGRIELFMGLHLRIPAI
jgi:hypothetical protein